MRRPRCARVRSCVTWAGLAVAAAAPAARAEVLAGEVIEARGRWTADGSRIVTDAVLRTPGGDVVVSQLGGTADGLGMRTFPGAPILAPGMRVAVRAHAALDARLRPSLVLDAVDDVVAPPGATPYFVRTGPTKGGHALYWESGCAFLTVDSAGTKEIAGDAEFGLVDEVLRAWNDGVARCSYMNVVSSGTAAVEVGRDRVNVLKFRDGSWCRPAVDGDPARCYPPSTAGLTTVVFVDDAGSDRDGAIVDADIELNGVDFAISAGGQTLGSAPCLSDLRNTLTHELGHLLGLEHTCLAGGDPARVDGAGQPVPACGATTTPAIVDATMYNYQDCGETKKQTLEPDDVAGVCAAYPLARDPGTCSPAGADGGGCCSASAGDGPLGGLALAALTLLAGGATSRGRRGGRRAARPASAPPRGGR